MQETVQLRTNQNTKGVNRTLSKTSSTKKDTVDASMADPFLQIIMNMLSQMDMSTNADGTNADATTTANDAQLSAVLGLVQDLPLNNLLSDGSSTGAANSTDLFSQLLTNGTGVDVSTLAALQKHGMSKTSDNTQLLNELLKLMGTDTTSQSALSGTDVTQPLLQQLSQLTQSGDTSALNAAQLAVLLNAQKVGTQNQTTATVDPNAFSQLAALKSVTSTSTDNDAGSDALLSQQQSYSQSIAKAKELLSKFSDDADDTQSADKLESSLSASKAATPFELRMQTAAKTESTSVAQQIETGLEKNLALGKNEFTIKLKPESLGEITVKLTEEAGKATLTITTASAATAKLLNSDLDALKAAVAPLNVRVNEAVTQTASAQQSGSQQFDMAGQQFSGQQQQQQFAQQFAARQNARYYNVSEGYDLANDENIYAAASAASAGIAARVASSSTLDAYV